MWKAEQGGFADIDLTQPFCEDEDANNEDYKKMQDLKKILSEYVVVNVVENGILSIDESYLETPERPSYFSQVEVGLEAKEEIVAEGSTTNSLEDCEGEQLVLARETPTSTEQKNLSFASNSTCSCYFTDCMEEKADEEQSVGGESKSEGIDSNNYYSEMEETEEESMGGEARAEDTESSNYSEVEENVEEEEEEEEEQTIGRELKADNNCSNQYHIDWNNYYSEMEETEDESMGGELKSADTKSSSYSEVKETEEASMEDGGESVSEFSGLEDNMKNDSVKNQEQESLTFYSYFVLGFVFVSYLYFCMFLLANVGLVSFFKF